LKPYQVQYALTTGLVEEPRLWIGGKRVFQADDLHRLAAHFGVDIRRDDKPLAGARPGSPSGS
jgi:hypothetical protein